MNFKSSLLNAVSTAVLSGGLVLGLMHSASAETLEAAMEKAYSTNPSLQAHRALLRATDEGLPQAKAGWRPSVTLSGSTTAQRQVTNGTLPRDTRVMYSTGVTVTQNFYNGGGTMAAIAKAEATISAERANLKSKEQTILLSVATAYMNVVRDQAVVELNKQNESRLARQLEASKDRFSVGEITRTDVAQSESRLARTKADRIDAEGNLAVSKANYEQVVGHVPKQLSSPKVKLNLPTSLKESTDLASKSNPDVISSEKNLEAAQQAVTVEYSDLLPSLDLTGTASDDRKTSGVDSSSQTLALKAAVSIPIYQQGTATSQLRAAKQTVSRYSALVDETRRKAVEAAASSWETHQSTLARISAIDEEVRASTIALEGVQQEADVGSRTILDVLDAEQELLDANVSLVRAQRDEIIARFNLVFATGTLSATEIGLSVSAYDVEKYYDETKDIYWGLGPDEGQY